MIAVWCMVWYGSLPFVRHDVVNMSRETVWECIMIENNIMNNIYL